MIFSEGGDSPSSRQHPVASFQAASAFPGASCAGFILRNTYALDFLQERYGSNPPDFLQQ